MRIARIAALPVTLGICALMAGLLSVPVSAASFTGGPPSSIAAQVAQNSAFGATEAAANAAKTAAFKDGDLKGYEPLAEHYEQLMPGIVCCGQFSREATTALVQYAQDTNYYCGPAVVSEMSASVYGPSPTGLSQYTVAAYMGTNSSGTNPSQELNGLNYYVGDPDFGPSEAYAFVRVSWNPTTTQENEFVDDLDWDVNVGTPVASGVYEVGDPYYPADQSLYPHLVGHPFPDTIQHWAAVGGYNWNDDEVYYADSATYMNQFGGGWAVPAHSWYSLANMEELLGGEGFIW